MADELIDIYNENNESLSIQKMKSEAHKDGLWHRASHVWIYNLRREILLQLRSSNKDLYPDMWDVSAAGHVGAGENVIDAAIRETEEEIGLLVKSEELEFFIIKKVKMLYKKMNNNEFFYIYLLKFNGKVNDLILQDEEVSKIKFVSIDKIEKDLNSILDSERCEYVPHGDYWFEVIEAVRKRI